MLITKFNSMIRSRVVWWIIGGVVIITFVGWFSPRGGCETIPASGQAGTLDGKPVQESEIRMARFNTYLELCLATGRMLRLTPEIDKELREEAWRRLAALRTAGKLGLTASREEVLAAITRNPDFQDNGTFSKPRYQQFIQATLGNLGASASQFEQYLAESIILRKLQNLTASAAWMAPSAMQRLVARYTDKYSIEYVTVDSNAVDAAAVGVTDDAVKAYYAANTNEFEVPAKVSVRYVTFPIPPHLAATTVRADAIDEYYDTHTEEFTVPGTNDTRTITPIDEVRGSISNTLAWEEATQMARDKATDMVIALAPGREEQGPPFEQVAATAGKPVTTSALFDAYAEFPGVTGAQELVSAAFRLRPTADEYFSDAIVAGNSVYVMALATNTEPYVPAFESIRASVLPLARRQAHAKAVRDKAATLHQTLTTAIARKESFAMTARQQGMNVSTTGYFSAYTATDALSSPQVFEELSTCNPGEITPVIPLADSYLIAHVIDRQPGQADDMNAARGQIVSGNARRRGRVLFTEFQDYLLRSGRRVEAAPQLDDQPSE